jgi:hypothetical protein
MENEMEKIAEKYAHKAVAPTSRPAPPDTTKFRAAVSGMIEVAHNVHVPGGQYGHPVTYELFLKIGGGVDHQTFKSIKKDVIEAVSNLVDDPTGLTIPVALYCDDLVVGFRKTEGSNWGGIGFTKPRKYTGFEKTQRDNYDLGD